MAALLPVWRQARVFQAWKISRTLSRMPSETPAAATIDAKQPYPHTVSPEVKSSSAQVFAAAGLSIAGLAGVYWGMTRTVPDQDPVTLTNWSGTHEVTTKLAELESLTMLWELGVRNAEFVCRSFFQPETMTELESIVAECHKNGQSLRVVGSALSPNGISFNEDGMLSMALLDKIISVDKESMQVRLQCGARVQDVVEALRPHGLTLQNFASIREQQIGGFTQVSAHGTGAGIPPVDEQVVSMKIVSPAKGSMELSMHDKDPSTFKLARVGLGCFGVVSEVTLQCVPVHKLVEKTFVASIREVKRQHSRWLKENRHLRYMWIPFTDSVVVVQCNPMKEGSNVASTLSQQSVNTALSSLRKLLAECAVNGMVGEYTLEQAENLKFTQMRDVLLSLDPLNISWVKRVNSAEAHYWKHSQNVRTGWSDEILGFDCGGQQWVLEVAMPAGSYSQPSHTDLQYMIDLLHEIEAGSIPAHSPIEQRWTAGSSSDLSPVSSKATDSLHSWVGIIMYIPTQDPAQREAITQRFREFATMAEAKLMPKYSAVWHWAKLELPETQPEVHRVCERIAERYPVKRVQALRKELDPRGILGNKLVDTIFK